MTGKKNAGKSKRQSGIRVLKKEVNDHIHPSPTIDLAAILAKHVHRAYEKVERHKHTK